MWRRRVVSARRPRACSNAREILDSELKTFTSAPHGHRNGLPMRSMRCPVASRWPGCAEFYRHVPSSPWADPGHNSPISTATPTSTSMRVISRCRRVSHRNPSCEPSMTRRCSATTSCCRPPTPWRSAQLLTERFGLPQWQFASLGDRGQHRCAAHRPRGPPDAQRSSSSTASTTAISTRRCGPAIDRRRHGRRRQRTRPRDSTNHRCPALQRPRRAARSPRTSATSPPSSSSRRSPTAGSSSDCRVRHLAQHRRACRQRRAHRRRDPRAVRRARRTPPSRPGARTC